MNRPQQVKEIYREFRMMLGNQFPDRELLEGANLLIEISEEKEPVTLDELLKFEYQYKDTNVDVGIKDGGWNLLTKEGWWDEITDDQDVLSLEAKAKLKDYGLELAA